MEPDIMHEVSGCIFSGVKCILHDYQRYAVRGEQYPGMVKEPGAQVEGVMYMNISTEALRRLDVFEGDMYDRKQVSVLNVANNERVVAMAYVVRAAYSHLLTQEIWSFDRFLKEGKRHFTEYYSGYGELGEAERTKEGE